MKKMNLFFSLLLLVALSFSVAVFNGCEQNPTSVERWQPEPEKLEVLKDGMPAANGIFFCLWNYPSNFTVNAAGFNSFTWFPRYNIAPTDSFHYNHKDFTYTWLVKGTYTMKIRGYRPDNTYRDTSYQIIVGDSIPVGGGDTTTCFRILQFQSNPVTGEYIYLVQVGASYNKFFAHIPYNPGLYKPGLVFRTATSFKVLNFTDVDTTTSLYGKTWRVWIKTYDTLATLHYVRWYDTLQSPSNWHYANLTSSIYYHDFGNGDKFIHIGLKAGVPMIWNTFTYTRPGNQGDNDWRWESDLSGNNRTVYFDIREVNFSNIQEIYWISTLTGHGMNNPLYNITAQGSTGYGKVTIPLSSIPVSDSGTVFMNVGKPYPGNLIPSISRTMFKYYNPVYGLCVRFQFYNGLKKPIQNNGHR